MAKVVRLRYVLAIVAFLACARAAGTQQASAQQPATAPDGGALFTTHCASCHGSSGRGDGPVAEFLKIPPADLTQIAKQSHGAFPVAQMIRIIDGRQVVRAHGDSKMPVWGDAFSQSLTHADEHVVRQKIEALVKYLQSIQERNARLRGETVATVELQH
jgi:mono/diheme cytochrome c family protein